MVYTTHTKAAEILPDIKYYIQYYNKHTFSLGP